MPSAAALRARRVAGGIEPGAPDVARRDARSVGQHAAGEALERLPGRGGGRYGTTVSDSSWADEGQPGDFAAALRSAIAERGLSLERVRFHLKQRGHDLSVATLSYWQSGRSRPDRASSLAALGSLEEILEAPRGSLAALLPARVRKPGSANPGNASIGSLFDTGRLIDEVIAGFGIDWDDLERVCLHEHLALRADRTVAFHRIREIMRATRDGVDRFVAFYGDDGAPYIMANNNCRLGRVVEHRDLGLVIAEMLLPQPLAMGDSVLVDYEYAIAGPATVCDGWERGCAQPQREVHLEVEFAPEALPSAVRMRVAHGDDDRSEPAALNGNLLSVLRLDVARGLIGLYWSW